MMLGMHESYIVVDMHRSLLWIVQEISLNKVLSFWDLKYKEISKWTGS